RRARPARGAREHGGGGRRARRGVPHRAARAHPRRLDARGGVHVADRRRGRVPLGGHHGNGSGREQGMSATVTAPAGGNEPAPAPAKRSRVRNVTFPRILRSEWIKLWTLRSTWWTLGSTVVIMAGFALMMAVVVQFLNDQMADVEMAAEDQASMDAVLGAPTVIAGGYEFAALVVGVLGAMVITGEYSTGMIRSTFAANPGRLGAY